MEDYFSSNPSPEMLLVLNSIREGVNRILGPLPEYKEVVFYDCRANTIQAYPVHQKRILESMNIDRSIWGGRADPFHSGTTSIPDSITGIISVWNRYSSDVYIKLMDNRDAYFAKHGTE